MKKNLYHAYGLSIVSDFEIDAFQEIGEVNENENLLYIEQQNVDFKGYDFEDDFVIREFTENGFLYVIKDVVAFIVTNSCIKVEPLVQDSNNWQSFLVGGAMSIVLNKRGFFLLHGSAVESENKAYLFLGHSGIGKSSTAIALGQRNYRIITDDVCPLSKENETLFINRGTKQARLLKDTVEKLGIENTTALDFPSVRPKLGYLFESNKSEKTTVGKIIELVVDEGMQAEILIEQIKSFEKIKLLKDNLYKEGLTKVVKGDQHGFQSIMKSVNNVECFRIRRKRADYDLKDLVDLIEQEFLLN